MKLKPVFLALSILGLVTGPALAASGAKAAAPKVIKAQEVIDQNSATSSVCDLGWTDRIKLGGLLNLDAMWGNHSPIGSFKKTNSSSDIVLNNANIFVDAKVNEWLNGHVNLAYFGYRHDLLVGSDSSASSSDLENRYGKKDFTLDEAYLTFADFAKSPLYVRVGQQRVAYGDYTPYPLVKSPTQAMTETDAVALAAGFVTDAGFYGNIFAFNGPTVNRPTYKNDVTEGNLDNTPGIRNLGAKLGYFGTMPALGMSDTHYNADVSFIRNMYDVDAVYQAMRNAGSFSDPASPSWYTSNILSDGVHPVGGLAAHFDASYKAFDFFANYATALKDLVQNEWLSSAYAGNTHFWAADLNAGYAFQTANRDSKVGLSYQWTGNGEFTAYNNGIGNTAFAWNEGLLSVPHNRWVADYSVNILKNTDLAFALVHAQSYDYQLTSSDAEDSREANSAFVRLSVQF